ncbi:hypothetical protein GCM10010994_45360 [Chelatococcus reniformis]|uniref:Uncharacterized protein n=1 Tax=Chelatococcus reniformis TaxID=1494448 RepID=A0A916UQX6_9HYPH|nr:hypothetical protein GCM10010994_45360 [Chelatococcus reniformis]
MSHNGRCASVCRLTTRAPDGPGAAFAGGLEQVRTSRARFGKDAGGPGAYPWRQRRRGSNILNRARLRLVPHRPRARRNARPERFRAKWTPVRVKKTRQTNK